MKERYPPEQVATWALRVAGIVVGAVLFVIVWGLTR